MSSKWRRGQISVALGESQALFKLLISIAASAVGKKRNPGSYSRNDGDYVSWYMICTSLLPQLSDEGSASVVARSRDIAIVLDALNAELKDHGFVTVKHECFGVWALCDSLTIVLVYAFPTHCIEVQVRRYALREDFERDCERGFSNSWYADAQAAASALMTEVCR